MKFKLSFSKILYGKLMVLTHELNINESNTLIRAINFLYEACKADEVYFVKNGVPQKVFIK